MSKEFYLVAHGCNNVKSVRKAIRQGANGIETDIYHDGKKWVVSHSGIIKTPVVDWLKGVNKICSESGGLAIIIFDIKTAHPLDDFYQAVKSILPEDQYRVFSTAKLKDAEMLKDLIPQLTTFEGISIDEEDNPEAVNTFFSILEFERCWYGNGITTVPINDTFHDCMKSAAKIRDNGGPISKIYSWTVTRKNAMKKYIMEDDVDGLLVNLNGILSRPIHKALKAIRRSGKKLANRRTNAFKTAAFVIK